MLPNAAGLDKLFEKFIPDDLNMTDAKERRQLADEMRKFYLKDKPIFDHAEGFREVIYFYKISNKS